MNWTAHGPAQRGTWFREEASPAEKGLCFQPVQQRQQGNLDSTGAQQYLWTELQ
jgi:hypothetical protein